MMHHISGITQIAESPKSFATRNKVASQLAQSPQSFATRNKVASQLAQSPQSFAARNKSASQLASSATEPRRIHASVWECFTATELPVSRPNKPQKQNSTDALDDVAEAIRASARRRALDR